MPSKRTSPGPSSSLQSSRGRNRSTGSSAPASHRPRISVLLLPASLLLVANLAVFAQTARFDFLNFDDDVYVTANPPVRAGLTPGGARWALTTLRESNWHPLTWLSLMLDAHLTGVKPGPFHITNLVLHAASTWLLLYLLWRTTGFVWRSAFVAALFAIHPLHVESVAWVSERKDVLSTVFWMLTMIFYSRYARDRHRTAYVLSLASFGLGLMSKPMLVTVPLVLLLWDAWPLRRDRAGGLTVKGAVLEKVPYFSMSLASGVMTLIAQSHGGAMGTTIRYPIGARLGNAVVSYTTYLQKTIVPSRLAIYYPHPLQAPPLWQIAGSLLLLAGITALVVGPLRRRRYLLAGWLWYLITLLPVIGLIQVGGQAMADRYSYVPLIGLFFMAAWGIPDLADFLVTRAFWLRSRPDPRIPRSSMDGGGAPTSGSAPGPLVSRVLAAAGAAVVVVLAARAHAQAGHFRDSVTVFEHALAATDDNFLAHSNLGTALFDRGEMGGAVAHLRDALRIEPGYPEALNNLAGVVLKQGKIEESKALSRQVIARWPGHPRAHTNLGLAFMIEGDLPEAAKHLTHALSLDPGFGDARLNLGVLLANQGKLDQAIAELQEVLRLNPYDQDARHSLERALEAKTRARAP